MKTMNGRKKRAAILAILLVAAMALTGTFAWRSISQRTTNEFLDVRNPGGRIHDDFNGLQNKDIYAENFTDIEHGMPVFVRVRLYEFMETGIDAGEKREDPNRKAVSVKPGAKIDDPSTWHLHNPATQDDPGEDPFHTYWKWDMDGGATAYLPTFNKNKDSLSVDVNGTYEGEDGLFNADDPYSDFKAYKVGDPDVTGKAYYDVDDNIDDEYDPATDEPGAGGYEVNDTSIPADTKPNYKAVEETHEISNTLSSKGIISMADWKAAGSPICNKWVYDTDGWFYWPEPVMPQTATGLLLSQVSQVNMSAEKCYYAINVVGQFATANDWGDQAGADKVAQGFFADHFSTDAQALLNQAATVKVYDGKWYLPVGQNVYQEITDDDGTLGDAVCAGVDLVPGTADDPTVLKFMEEGVNVNGTPYGKYYLQSPIDGLTGVDVYRVNAGDLGTASDTLYWLTDTTATFPSDKVTTEPIKSITVTENDGKTEVAPEGSLNFKSTAEKASDSIWGSIEWSLSGNTDPNTNIDSTGKLTVGAEETAKQLKVIATSKLDPRKSGSTIVDVVLPKTITLDGKEYLVLKEDADNSRALILSKNITENKAFDDAGTHVIWGNNSMRTYLNGEWLDSQTELKALAQETALYNRFAVDKAEWETTYDKVFLLTEADLFGTFVHRTANSKDYTAGEKLNAPEGGWGATLADGTPASYFLRSCGSGCVATVHEGALTTGTAGNSSGGVRPAAFIWTTGVEITSPHNTVCVEAGGTLDLGATVYKDMKRATDQNVKWTVTGDNLGTGTTIDETGLLTAAADASGTLTVTATTTDGSNLSNSLDINVIVPCTTITGNVGDTVTVDGAPYKLLSKYDKYVLLVRENSLSKPFVFSNSDNVRWKDSAIREYLNETYLKENPTLAASAIETYITTRSTYDGDGYIITKDRVFLLSEAEVFGSAKGGTVTDSSVNSNEYAWGITGKLFGNDRSDKVVYMDGDTTESHGWVLRSPAGQSDKVACVGSEGNLTNITCQTKIAIRPAFWIKVQ